MSNPFFSILISSHDPKRKNLPIQAVNSVLMQDIKEGFEIIVIKDYLENEVDEYLANLDVIVIDTHETFTGPKILLGIKKSRGEFIAFLDDDLFDVDKLSRIYREIQNDPDIVLIKHNVRLIDYNNKLIGKNDNEFIKNLQSDIVFFSKKLPDKYINVMKHLTKTSTNGN